MRLYYHTTSLDNLRRIVSTGYIKAPVFVTGKAIATFGGSNDVTLELDLRGFRLSKDPHPWAIEGYYFVKKDIPKSRIVDANYRLSLVAEGKTDNLDLPSRVRKRITYRLGQADREFIDNFPLSLGQEGAIE